MRDFSQSLLGRTFLWLALLVLLTTSAWLTIFRLLDTEPRAKETAQLAASAVNLIRASLFAAAPEKRLALFAEFSTREGIRLLPAEPEDKVIDFPDDRFFKLVRNELAARLGGHTRIASEVDGVPGFWVTFRLEDEDDEEFWLVLPRTRLERDIARHWIVWGLLAAALSLVIAWIIATRTSRPLRAMARSARQLGLGQTPAPLPESGPTELKLLSSSFNKMSSNLRQMEEDRSLVLAGISHDLRTPLTRLRLEAEISIDDENTRQAMVADIEQMDSIISQFMDYARGDAGEPQTPTSIMDCLAPLVQREKSRHRPLDTIFSPSLTELAPQSLRPKALLRAMSNLVDNAWKYGATQVSLQGEVIANQIYLCILDNGPGIPETEIERLKRPFTRLESARTNTTGTGLGLAIVERIAKNHGGTLEIKNRPEGGLSATVIFPITY